MTRFVIDAPTLLHVVAESVPVARGHQLVAPQLLRSQALDLLFQAVRRGELSEREALDRHEAMTGVKLRLLGDRVSRGSAWRIAREHGLDSTADAEYLAITRLQADYFVSVDPEARKRADGIVPVGTVDQLSALRRQQSVAGATEPGAPATAQSAGSSVQSGPLTSPMPARSAASTIVYA